MRIHHTNRLTRLHIVAGLLLGGFCLSTASGQASFQGLGAFEALTFFSSAQSVSADGSVVVGKSISTSGTEAFRWTSEGGMVGLRDLLGGIFRSEALGVSADGSVVVGRGFGLSGTEAFCWTSESGMVGMGDLAGGIFRSVAEDVSDDGSVVVGWSWSVSGQEAFRWTIDNGMRGERDLIGGIFSSRALGVSADGSIVVGWGTGVWGREAFRRPRDSGIIGLGQAARSANDVSADGSVIVGSMGILRPEAFRWTIEDSVVGLGRLAGGCFDSSAYGVSANGTIIVGSGCNESGEVAFIWDAANGMQSLQKILEIPMGLDLTGWTLIRATDISADGTTIVGWGTNPAGVTEAFITVLPVIPHRDSDSDGIPDDEDNCPNDANPGQEDTDGDGPGDVCDDCPLDPDNDLDIDGWCSDEDNCPDVANTGQEDADGDGLGDVCDDCPLDPDNDLDGDGVCGDEDCQPDSDFTPTVLIDGCDSGVENVLLANGCTLFDLIWFCADDANNHGQFMSCVVHLTNEWKQSGLISEQEKGQIRSCLAQADIPGDLDGDGIVNVTDLLQVLAAWGPNPGHAADINGDRIVNVTDLLTLLANWG